MAVLGLRQAAPRPFPTPDWAAGPGDRRLQVERAGQQRQARAAADFHPRLARPPWAVVVSPCRRASRSASTWLFQPSSMMIFFSARVRRSWNTSLITLPWRPSSHSDSGDVRHGADEAGEQRVRPRRLRLELGMELHGHKPGMLGNSTISTSEPSGLVPTMLMPAASNCCR